MYMNIDKSKIYRINLGLPHLFVVVSFVLTVAEVLGCSGAEDFTKF